MTDLLVDVVRDPSTFIAMRDEWDALVERARIDHPFLTHDWVRTFWECFGDGKELHVLTVRAGDRLVALAPLVRTRTRMYGVPVSRLEFLANAHTPRFDFVVAERADEVYPALLDYLQDHESSWDVVMLPELAEGCRTLLELPRLATTRSLRSGVWSAGASPRIALPESFEAFYNTALSAKRRSSMRRRQRQLEALGAVSMTVATTLPELPDALSHLLRLEAATWKGEAGTAIALDEHVKSFYERLAERTAQSQSLRLFFLQVDEKPIAGAYFLQHGSTLYLLKSGYDPKYATYSPSNALLLRVVEAAFRQGITTIDLLGCDDPWKHTWTDVVVGRRWLFLFRNAPRARLVCLLKFELVPRLRRLRSSLVSGERAAEQSAPATLGASES